MKRYSEISSRTQPIVPTFRKAALAVVMALLAAAPGWALSGMGTAEVTLLEDGRACFAVPAKNAKRDPAARIQAMSVVDDADPSGRKMWAPRLWEMQGGGLPVSSLSCIAYGQALEGVPAAPALELAENRAYYVSLNVRPSDRSDPTRGYYAKFCVLGRGAERRIKLIAENSPGWETGSCQ